MTNARSLSRSKLSHAPRRMSPASRIEHPRRSAREAGAMSTVLITQPASGVTQITLNRPERLNAMNAELIAELHGALDDIATDRHCRAVVLTGAGRGFCAGVDLKGYGTPPGGDGLGRVPGTFAIQ